MKVRRVTFDRKGITARTRKAAARGLRLGCEHLLDESRRQVPHEDGDLERSGFVDVDENALLGVVGYDTPYAVAQHEELDWEHDQGRNAKYLEEPLLAEERTIEQLIAREIARELT